MDYLILIHSDETAGMPGPDIPGFEEVMTAWAAYDQRLIDGGHRIAGASLQPTATATTVTLAANARTAADTDWPAIAAAYAQLHALTGSPVVALNHAVAVAMADGLHAGLALLDGVTGLEHYHLLHAARGELLLRAGAKEQAHAAFTRALDTVVNPAERRHLRRRLVQAT